MEAHTFPTIRGNSPSTGWTGAVAGFFSAGLVLGLLVLGVGFIVLSFVVYAGLCAAVGGLLIFLASRWLGKRLGHEDPPGLADCFTAAYWGYLIALSIGLGVALLRDGTAGFAARAASSTPAYPETIGDVFALDVLRQFGSWLWPGIPITTFALSLTHRMYRGLAGVGRGLVLTVVALPGSLLVPLAILVGWQQRTTGIGGFDGFGTAVLGLGVLLLVHAVVGGLFAGPVLSVVSRGRDVRHAPSPWRVYGTAVLALLVWGGVTIVVVFLIPLFDPFSGHLWNMARSGEALGYMVARPWLVPAAAVTFGLLQAPGVIVASRVVGARLGAAEVGNRGTPPRILRLTAAAAAATWPVALALAWLLASAPT